MQAFVTEDFCVEFFAAWRGAKYRNEHVGMSVSLSLCTLSYLKNNMLKYFMKLKPWQQHYSLNQN